MFAEERRLDARLAEDVDAARDAREHEGHAAPAGHLVRLFQLERSAPSSFFCLAIVAGVFARFLLELTVFCDFLFFFSSLFMCFAIEILWRKTQLDFGLNLE